MAHVPQTGGARSRIPASDCSAHNRRGWISSFGLFKRSVPNGSTNAINPTTSRDTENIGHLPPPTLTYQADSADARQA
jgi:hypothetical protein